ncbi:MAG: DUF4188 domain-containing protein [Pseudomonadota bacterium]
MAKILHEYQTARIEGDFVVFLIGMRINKFWKFWKWMPIAAAMPRMLVQLAKRPELGLLHARTHAGIRNIMVVQYWESFEKLHAFSRDPELSHIPAWQAFNKAVKNNGDVGIWHETYLIRSGEYECIYGNMPRYGLGQAGDLVSAKGHLRHAKDRLHQTK